MVSACVASPHVINCSCFTRSHCTPHTNYGVTSLGQCSVGPVVRALRPRKGVARRKRSAKGKKNYENAQNGVIHVSALCESSPICMC